MKSVWGRGERLSRILFASASCRLRRAARPRVELVHLLEEDTLEICTPCLSRRGRTTCRRKTVSPPMNYSWPVWKTKAALLQCQASNGVHHNGLRMTRDVATLTFSSSTGNSPVTYSHMMIIYPHHTLARSSFRRVSTRLLVRTVGVKIGENIGIDGGYSGPAKAWFAS